LLVYYLQNFQKARACIAFKMYSKRYRKLQSAILNLIIVTIMRPFPLSRTFPSYILRSWQAGLIDSVTSEIAVVLCKGPFHEGSIILLEETA
jgi:hypothetical protein